MNEISIVNYFVCDKVKGICVPNTFETFSGKYPGIGRYLISDPTTQFSDALYGTGVLLEIVTAISGGGKYSGKHEHTMSVYPAGAMPVSLANTSTQVDMYELICYDARHDLLDVIISAQYNMQRNTPAGLAWIDNTLNSGSEWTWEQIISEIDNLLPGTAKFENRGTLPTHYTPRNLSFNCCTIGEAMQIIAAQLFMVLGYDNNETFTLYNPGQISATNQALFDRYDDSVTNVRDNLQLMRMTRNLPANYDVCYPNYYDGEVTQDDQLSDPFYHKVIEVNVGGRPDKSKPLHLGNFYAERDSAGTVTNQAELDDVAAEMAARAYSFVNQNAQTFEYPMAVSFVLDGYIRGIKWTDTSTIIQINNDKSSNPLWQIERNVEQIGNATLNTINGVVSGTASGKMIAPREKLIADSFFAIITRYAEADAPAQNRWTYTFTELAATGKAAGYDGWGNKTGGRTGTAYNFVEDGNTNAGGVPEMNGVDPNNLIDVDYIASIQPAQIGVIVVMYEIIIAGGGMEYWFSYENGVDGFCV